MRFLIVLAGMLAMSIDIPPSYTVPGTIASHDDLLNASSPAWQPAAIAEWGPAAYSTRFRALWNDRGLYIRFDAVDAAPWSTMRQRDDHLWEEEVVEIFIDPDRSGRKYAELEISPANVVCDVRMIAGMPNKQMDLAWNFQGIESRVTPLRQDGATIGWTAAAFLPWADFATLEQSPVALPPKAGERWRFNLFRIKRPGGKARPEEGAVQVAWSPTHQPSFHVPEAFGDLIFGSR